LTTVRLRAYCVVLMQNFASRDRKTTAMRLVEAENGIELGAYLTEQYHERGLRLADIGSALGVDVGTVSRWMDRLQIPRRVRTTVPTEAVA
jgi:DNA-binding MarR family transcriptional regulator